MTEGGGSGLPDNDVVMPAQAGIQYAVSARSGNALIAMAVSTGLPACAGNDGGRTNGPGRGCGPEPWLRVRPSAGAARQRSRSILLVGLLGPLEGGAQDVAQRGARIGGAVLGDRLLLLGHLEGLDGDLDLVGAAIELGHAGVDLLADREAFRALLGAVAGQIGEVDHAVDVAVEPEKEAELGLVLDLALDDGAGRILLDEDLPGIAHGLLEAERDAALDRIDLEDLHLHLLRGGDDLAGMHVLLGPRHLGDVDEALDAGLELHEGAVVGEVGDAALEAGADRELGLDALPRIGLQLLHAERDAVGLVVDLDDLDLDLLADVEHLGGVIDAPPRDVGDVQQAVDAAEIHEGAVVGDVLDHAVDDLALFEILHQLLALLGAGLFQHGAAGDHDVAAAAVHLEDLERLRHVHQRRDVADRPDVDLRARQEGDRAVEVDREAALHLVEDDALDLLVALERLL